MRIHSFQHVAFEDIGSMLHDIQQQGHSLSTTHWYQGQQPPAVDDYDLLIVMGGPMGVYDEAQLPWLADEKRAIAAAIAAGKKIIGVCLGAQLIACVLGAPVTRNPQREIGWFPLQIHDDARELAIAKVLAKTPAVFHWHGDTFALPAQARLIASSQACQHQAYVIGEQIYGFQFHLETTETSAKALIEHCAADLDGSSFVQSAAEILRDSRRFSAINQCMSEVWQLIIENS